MAVKTEYIKTCNVLRTVRAMQQSRSQGFGIVRFSEYSKLSVYKKGIRITSHLSCEVNFWWIQIRKQSSQNLSEKPENWRNFRGREDPPNLTWNNENRVFKYINIHLRRHHKAPHTQEREASRGRGGGDTTDRCKLTACVGKSYPACHTGQHTPDPSLRLLGSAIVRQHPATPRRIKNENTPRKPLYKRKISSKFKAFGRTLPLQTGLPWIGDSICITRG